MKEGGVGEEVLGNGIKIICDKESKSHGIMRIGRYGVVATDAASLFPIAVSLRFRRLLGNHGCPGPLGAALCQAHTARSQFINHLQLECKQHKNLTCSHDNGGFGLGWP